VRWADALLIQGFMIYSSDRMRDGNRDDAGRLID
jgi:hypothetical protein